MNPPDPESKSNNFLFAALVGSIAVLFGIFGCYAFIGYLAGESKEDTRTRYR